MRFLHNNKFGMKKSLIIIVSTFLCFAVAIAQKPSSKTPTAADLQKMMQDAMSQKAIQQASKNSGMNLDGIANAAANRNMKFKIPVKDVKRIASIPGGILSYTELCNYIKQVHQAIEKKLQPQNLAEVNTFYNQLKDDPLHTNTADNAASGCMMMGDVNIALWLMGKACIDNPTNTNTLNNYAAFLIMNGGEHLAIPILKRLNYVYPKNVTVLNNLGQAWFGLGDLDLAKKYLDTVQIFFPGHSQASNTQSYIAESKGNKEGAIQQAKQSISTVYSLAKEKHIKKMDGKLTDGDINWSLHVPEDALGFDKLLTQRPAFYTNRNEFIALQPQWAGFLEGVNNLYEKTSGKASAGIEEAMMNVPPIKEVNGKIVVPAFWVHKAQAKLDIENDDYNDHAVAFLEKRQDFETTILKYIQDLESADSAVTERYSKLLEKATGKEYDALIKRRDNELCTLKKNFVQKCFALNNQMREYYEEFTNREKRYRKNSIYYKKFIVPTQEMYEKMQQMDIMGFLAMIGQLAPISFDPAFQAIGDVDVLGYDFSNCTPPEIKTGFIKELPDFDVVNCKSESSFTVPKIGKIILQCNIMTTELDASFIPLHGSYKENWVKDQFIEGGIGIGGEVGIVDLGVDLNFNDKGFVDGTVKIEKDVDILKGVQGPLQVGVKGVVGVEIGFGTDGIEDVTVSGDVKGSVNASGGDKENLVGKELNVKTGASASMTWNAGGYSDSKGKLSGVSVAGFK